MSVYSNGFPSTPVQNGMFISQQSRPTIELHRFPQTSGMRCFIPTRGLTPVDLRASRLLSFLHYMTGLCGKAGALKISKRKKSKRKRMEMWKPGCRTRGHHQVDPDRTCHHIETSRCSHNAARSQSIKDNDSKLIKPGSAILGCLRSSGEH